MHPTIVKTTTTQTVCLTVLCVLAGAALVQSSPFLNKDDMTKIKDLVDAELLKREIDSYVEQRMKAVAQPRRVYKKAASFFHAQMDKIKPALLENFAKMEAQASKEPAKMTAAEEIKALEKAKEQEEAKKKLEEEILALVKTTAKPTTAAPKITEAPTTQPNNEIHVAETVDKMYQQEDCIDMYETEKCKILRDEFDMCEKDRMKEMCKETCGYCPKKAFAFINCHTTKYGCCADGVNAKNDPLGTQCCVDNIPELCQGEGNVNDCNSIEFVGNWMRKYCKKTCQICTQEKPRCEDDPEQQMFCPSWKEDGLCQTVPDLMKKHCKKSCGLCPDGFMAFLAHKRRR